MRTELQGILQNKLCISLSQRQVDNLMRIPATIFGLLIATGLCINLATTPAPSTQDVLPMTSELSIQLDNCYRAGDPTEIADCKDRVLKTR